MTTLNQKIELVKTAANMVEIESVLASVTNDYLNRYATEQDKAPCDVSKQPEWVLRANMYFVFDIVRDCNKIWEAVPARFHKTAMYKSIGKIYA